MAEKASISPATAAGAHTLINTEATTTEQGGRNLKYRDTTMTSNYISNKDNINTSIPDAVENEAAHASDAGLLPEIEGIDPDLLADAVEQLNKAVADRAATSRENGMQGGRPPLDRNGLAERCIDAVFVHHGEKLLRRFTGSWFRYAKGKYKRTNDEEIENAVTAFLTREPELKGAVTTSLVRDVMNIMKSVRYCGLSESTHHLPCFISSGADASRFLPMQNGILDIEATLNAMNDGSPLPPLFPNTPDLFCEHALEYDYDPTAECPLFLRYLKEVQPAQENRECLQMMAGLLLVHDCSYNVAFFLYGEGGTGKSVFMNVLEEMLGEENCCSVPLANLGDRFAKIGLTENMANLVGDMPVVPDSGRLAEMEGILKTVTSGETLFVERKGKDGWEARATARCVFATNELPPFSDRSNGIWDRLRIIPFNVVFRNTERQNPHLSEDLLAERSGILNWALHGLLKLRGLKTFPQCSEGAACLEEHRIACDHEKAYLQERTMSDLDGCISSRLLYEDYKDWMRRNNYRPLGMQRFKRAVLQAYPNATHSECERTVQGRMAVFHGISWYN